MEESEEEDSGEKWRIQRKGIQGRDGGVTRRGFRREVRSHRKRIQERDGGFRGRRFRGEVVDSEEEHTALIASIMDTPNAISIVYLYLFRFFNFFD